MTAPSRESQLQVLIAKIAKRKREAAEHISIPEDCVHRGSYQMCKNALLAEAEELEAALLLREGQESVCKTCQGRGWIMRSETRDLGNGLGAGGVWNAPCPDCKPPGLREGPQETPRLRALAIMAAREAHEDAIRCSQDYLGHKDDMADETAATLGFATCPHPDCVLVREGAE
jgi:hypothetical protein